MADTVSNGGLGEWIGYIRQLAAIDETGKILLQENVETVTFQSLADLAEKAPEAAYIIPFLNVYAAPNADDYLIVDVNGGYHKAVISKNQEQLYQNFRMRLCNSNTDCRIRNGLQRSGNEYHC